MVYEEQGGTDMEFDLSTLQPKERASFALRALYEAAGCRKYHMGRFEEYSLYQANRSFLSSEQVITFTDLDGRLLALKPDVTLSIAKTAQPAPGETLRYYYHENVYRPSAESHTFKEIGQMGLEFLGGVGEAEVQQAVCLAAQSLGQLGTDWVLEVSHMGYLFGLLDALQVPEDARAGLLRKLGQKNAHELRAAALAAGLDEDTADTLCRVLAGPLEQAGGAIRLDLTLAGEMEYYNGLVFQGYLKALPRPLLKGGRYDLLMQQFTPGAGAIGFAVYLDELDRLSAPLPPVQKNSTDKFAKMMFSIPGLPKFVIWLAYHLDKHGLLPRKIIDLSPFHTSMFITNLASIKTSYIHHHCYEFGTTSVVVCMGKPVPNYMNGDLTKKMMPLGIVMDERICTGYEYAAFCHDFRRCLRVLTCLETPFDGSAPAEMPQAEEAAPAEA